MWDALYEYYEMLQMISQSYFVISDKVHDKITYTT